LTSSDPYTASDCTVRTRQPFARTVAILVLLPTARGRAIILRPKSLVLHWKILWDMAQAPLLSPLRSRNRIDIPPSLRQQSYVGDQTRCWIADQHRVQKRYAEFRELLAAELPCTGLYSRNLSWAFLLSLIECFWFEGLGQYSRPSNFNRQRKVRRFLYSARTSRNLTRICSNRAASSFSKPRSVGR
jgi:hypothetical protein